MKILIAMIATVSFLSGCVIAPPNDHDYRRDNGGYYRDGDHDRDHDGMPDHQDRRPDNPGRY